MREEIKELKKHKQEDLIKNLDLQISNKFHYDDIIKIVKTPVPAKIKSSQCGKLPRFNHTNENSPSLDDIKFFYNLDYYQFSFFTDLLYTLEKDPDILSYVPTPISHTPPDDIICEDNNSFSYDFPIIYKKDTVDILCTSESSDSSGSDSDLPMTPSESGKGHSISFPSQGKNVVSLSQTKNPDSNIYNKQYKRKFC